MVPEALYGARVVSKARRLVVGHGEGLWAPINRLRETNMEVTVYIIRLEAITDIEQ